MSRHFTRLKRRLVSRLDPAQRLWLSRLRHGEHPWQLRRRTPPGDYRTHHHAYDARLNAAENLAAVCERLSTAGIPHAVLPARDVFDQKVVVPAGRISEVVDRLATLPSGAGWTVTPGGDVPGSPLPAGELRRNRAGLARRPPSTLWVERVVFAPHGIRLSTPRERVCIEAWQELGPDDERADGSGHLPGTLHAGPDHRVGDVAYLTARQWEAAQSNGHRVPLAGSGHLFTVTEPIDLVYTWVDGSDPLWRNRKAEALSGLDTGEINGSAISDSRFATRDELLYSLRSVEMYASWARHIYLVTDRQLPAWLDTGHPKISVVDHRQIFSDPSALPVFNSHAIESQLHHIPGLSERYLYMNDDIFFGRPTGPELFFTSNGMTKFFPSKAVLDVDAPTARDLPVLSAAKNNRRLIEEIHGRAITNKFKHTPHPQSREVLRDLEERFPGIFKAVQASRVRHPDDYSIASALHHYHAYATGRAVEGGIRYAYLDIARDDAELYLARLARRRDLDVICLNDTDSAPEQAERIGRLLHDFLERRFPIPSSFERNRTP